MRVIVVSDYRIDELVNIYPPSGTSGATVRLRDASNLRVDDRQMLAPALLESVPTVEYRYTPEHQGGGWAEQFPNIYLEDVAWSWKVPESKLAWLHALLGEDRYSRGDWLSESQLLCATPESCTQAGHTCQGYFGTYSESATEFEVVKISRVLFEAREPADSGREPNPAYEEAGDSIGYTMTRDHDASGRPLYYKGRQPGQPGLTDARVEATDVQWRRERTSPDTVLAEQMKHSAYRLARDIQDRQRGSRTFRRNDLPSMSGVTFVPDPHSPVGEVGDVDELRPPSEESDLSGSTGPSGTLYTATSIKGVYPNTAYPERLHPVLAYLLDRARRVSSNRQGDQAGKCAETHTLSDLLWKYCPQPEGLDPAQEVVRLRVIFERKGIVLSTCWLRTGSYEGPCPNCAYVRQKLALGHVDVFQTVADAERAEAPPDGMHPVCWEMLRDARRALRAEGRPLPRRMDCHGLVQLSTHLWRRYPRLREIPQNSAELIVGMRRHVGSQLESCHCGHCANILERLSREPQPDHDAFPEPEKSAMKGSATPRLNEDKRQVRAERLAAYGDHRDTAVVQQESYRELERLYRDFLRASAETARLGSSYEEFIRRERRRDPKAAVGSRSAYAAAREGAVQTSKDATDAWERFRTRSPLTEDAMREREEAIRSSYDGYVAGDVPSPEQLALLRDTSE